jgi:hypothetical protein
MLSSPNLTSVKRVSQKIFATRTATKVKARDLLSDVGCLRPTTTLLEGAATSLSLINPINALQQYHLDSNNKKRKRKRRSRRNKMAIAAVAATVTFQY